MSSSPTNKDKFLDRLADESGVAIVVVDEESTDVSVSNNNSICRSLYGSEEFAPDCEEFCGRAFEWATGSGGPVDYVCHAGLSCRAIPVREGGRQYVAIVGRTFLKAERYRQATENAITGIWRQFRPTEFFENVLISGSTQGIDLASVRLEKFTNRERNDILELGQIHSVPAEPAEPVQDTAPAEHITPNQHPPELEDTGKLTTKPSKDGEQAEDVPKSAPANDVQQDRQAAAELRSLAGSLMKMKYREACNAVLDYLQQRYGFDSLVWLERRGDKLEMLVANGEFADKSVKLTISADNQRLLDAAERRLPVGFREKQSINAGQERVLSLFPVVLNGELRGAIGVNIPVSDPELGRSISRLAQTLASQLEILRLRDEVTRRDWLASAVIKFNENLRQIDSEDFWMRITQVSAELLGAERASILVRNEKSNSLQAKAAIGAKINLLSEPAVGDRVASRILEIGNPVVVADITGVGIDRAPADWSYKTSSFLSFPIMIDDRRIGVMNFTDKAGGSIFNKADLELLQAIGPQIAVAIDRTALKDKAGEYEQLSLTDPLTGLLNRRYLEERIAEEIVRSKRHRFSLSLMMLDVDDFKAYNDKFGHPAGDSALKAVADVLKETLRGADVAARYGGEEFAILLPQTSSEEAAQIAERIRRKIERTEFPERKVTASIGIASCSNEVDTPRDLISAADVALYAAKNQGRNNVQIFEAWGESINENIH